MKITDNHLVAIVFIGFLTFAFIYGNSLTPQISPTATTTPSQTPQLIGSDEIIAAPDIQVYSQGSIAIVEGTVKTIQSHNSDTNSAYNDATITIQKVLKGDPAMSTVNVMIPKQASLVQSVEENSILNLGEKVLLFLGIDSQGNYVIAGSYAGKCLINADGNVTGQAAFSMPLTDLEAKILAALN